MNPVRIGNTIRILRIKAGYTQRQIANLVGVTDKAVSKWERGLSVPDVSLISKLSLILNVDAENLLEGNTAYLDNKWQGLLILKEYPGLFAGKEVYGKPLVNIFLSYFLLAGIGSIFVSCTTRDRIYIEKQIGNGALYGIKLQFLEEGTIDHMQAGNTMVVHNNPFIYGANLTKYFHRAISRSNGISVLTIEKDEGTETEMYFDRFREVQKAETCGIKYRCVPILFFPRIYFDQVERYEDLFQLKPLYAEPMGNGMIEYTVVDEETLWNTSFFFRFMKKQMGKEVYNLGEIAHNRGFID